MVEQRDPRGFQRVSTNGSREFVSAGFRTWMRVEQSMLGVVVRFWTPLFVLAPFYCYQALESTYRPQMRLCELHVGHCLEYSAYEAQQRLLQTISELDSKVRLLSMIEARYL